MGDEGPGAAEFLTGLPLGSRVAGYRLEEQIGQGGMAVVFRAQDDRLQRQVALKILSPRLATDEKFRHRFIRESRSAAAVDDPHIIPVFEAGDADGMLFIAMRYVPGGDVGTLVRRWARCPWRGRLRLSPRWPQPWMLPMPPGWCTVTSSRAICSSTRGPAGPIMCTCQISG